MTPDIAPDSFSGADRNDARTARLILADAHRAHGTRFRPVRPLRGGFQSGAWLVRAADGAGGLAVLKWSPDSNGAARILRAARAVERARAAGYPTPGWLVAGVAQSGLPYHIQQFVPGASAERLTAEAAERLVPVLESQRGIDPDPGHCWSRYTRDRLAGGLGGIRQALATGPEGRRFVAAVDALLAAHEDSGLPTGDLVHGDFRLQNILFRSGRVAAVVDAEALGSGTRAFDYATLLTVDDVDPAGWDIIRAAGERVAGPGVLARSFALAAVELAGFVSARGPGRLPVIIGPLTRRAMALRPRAPG
ncbi:phosphotransferase [Streptomyces litchfieldiae]|uniref:Phosphotransferase n=1 Tax=Streptomyces litchfieldiae TaxID=3075543 RepID=A0ABU2MZV4_9ACTN|nr:phosphotransferase [Streptomyces sp. DSM 44938]MDT0347160.1 phosphotransferase [Streptomyces sp. DSM 44938]